ncbi:hypothetical protein DFH07DRAFT_1010250 [Mycena maculata]|uniref:Uncharacterized protein n=1 Tax=Mycena maculata TaxID=230809 RepID=A0AAD7P065_9AGAR|nr:hypothetical protein DFH07DRAFT_1010250 [Mycena maculata]
MHDHWSLLLLAFLQISPSFSQLSVDTPSVTQFLLLVVALLIRLIQFERFGLSNCRALLARRNWTVVAGMITLLLIDNFCHNFQSIVSANPPNQALDNFGSVSEPSLSWTVDVAAGDSVIVQVQDSAGESGQSAPFTIHPGVMLNGVCLAGANAGAGQLPTDSSQSTPTPSSTSNSSPNTNSGGVGNTEIDGNSTDTANTGANTAGDGGGTSTSSQKDSAGTSNTAAVSQPSGQDSQPNGQDSPSGAPTSSINSPTNSSPSSFPTSPSLTGTDSIGQFPSTANSGLGSSISDPTQNPITPAQSETTGGAGGAKLPGTDVPPSNSLASAEPGQSVTSTSNVDFANKNVMSGSIIGGVIAAVLCVLVVVFCVIRRRRHRLNTPDRLSYPFAASDTETGTPREMVGRSGYPASAFSSWGNHGDLSDERVLSPTAPLTDGGSEGNRPWQSGQGTIESRYNAAFTPGHTVSTSSIDRNDPTSRQRFRGPIPKSMTDAHQAGPAESSSALLGEQLHSPRSDEAHPVQIFDEVRPQEMPSDTAVPDMMRAGRHPVIGYPPPYTSN